MASSQISVRIDSATKAAAEDIFNSLGLSATEAIRMFYKQVELQHGLPFSVKVPNATTLAAIREADAGGGTPMTLAEFKKSLGL